MPLENVTRAQERKRRRRFLKEIVETGEMGCDTGVLDRQGVDKTDKTLANHGISEGAARVSNLAGRQGVFARTFPIFAEFSRRSPIPSDSAACVQNALVFAFVGLRPFSNFASQMELEVEVDPFWQSFDTA